eukprot:Sspe_Gene.102062::Locus_76806_Transcript_1_1_Confidence_1.000_Length_660::g.102062::m.102062
MSPTPPSPFPLAGRHAQEVPEEVVEAFLRPPSPSLGLQKVEAVIPPPLFFPHCHHHPIPPFFRHCGMRDFYFIPHSYQLAPRPLWAAGCLPLVLNSGRYAKNRPSHTT